MSSSPIPDPKEQEDQETQIETQETQDVGSVAEGSGVPGVDDKVQPKKQRAKREPTTLIREPGKSNLPFSRVQKIIRADKEIPIIAKEATFLISLATEEFIKRLCEAGQQQADREKRATVQHKDIATVVRRADEFMFLEDIIPWTTSEPAPKRPKPGTKAEGGLERGPTLLDQFVNTGKEDEMESQEVILNEDGTMTMYTGGDV